MSMDAAQAAMHLKNIDQHRSDDQMTKKVHSRSLSGITRKDSRWRHHGKDGTERTARRGVACRCTYVAGCKVDDRQSKRVAG